MGLRRQLPQLTTPRGSSATLAQPLQQQQAAQRAPGPTTDQPRSEPLWARQLGSSLLRYLCCISRSEASERGRRFVQFAFSHARFAKAGCTIAYRGDFDWPGIAIA